LFGKLYVLLGNSNHVEAFLKPAPALFFIQLFLILLAVKWRAIGMQQSFGSVNQPGGGCEHIVDGHGGTRIGRKSGIGERVGGIGAEFGILVVVGCSLATAGLLLSWTL
jgi:hypothetical protein